MTSLWKNKIQNLNNGWQSPLSSTFLTDFIICHPPTTLQPQCIHYYTVALLASPLVPLNMPRWYLFVVPSARNSLYSFILSIVTEGLQWARHFLGYGDMVMRRTDKHPFPLWAFILALPLGFSHFQLFLVPQILDHMSPQRDTPCPPLFWVLPSLNSSIIVTAPIYFLPAFY